MDRSKIAIIGNECCNIGSYLYRNTAPAFSADFDCFHLLFREGFPADAAAWAQENRVAGVVLGGSLKSPLNQEQWIRDEEEFARQLVDAGMPILGICFGHELLASALGGELDKMRTINLCAADVRLHVADEPLFEGYGDTIRSLMAHTVFVKKLPPGFISLATEDRCEFAAMKHDTLPVYGIQFHPEIDREIKEHDPIWRLMPDDHFAQNRGFRVLENFCKIVRRSKTAATKA